MNDADWMKRVAEEASLRLNDTRPFGVSVSAYLVHKRGIISIGHNMRKTHPLAKKFSKHPEAVYLHAELACILNAAKYDFEWDKCTLYVCRVKFRDESKKLIVWGSAKPCEGCAAAIAYYKIPRVVFSLDSGGYEVVE